MESVLAGRTVVEVSQSPAAGLATMVMADFGADVIWFEYGGRNGSRAKPEKPGEGYRVWHRGKRRIPVNLSATMTLRTLRLTRCASIFLPVQTFLSPTSASNVLGSWALTGLPWARGVLTWCTQRSVLLVMTILFQSSRQMAIAECRKRVW